VKFAQDTGTATIPQALMHSRPPKPRLTLRIGITGHRPNKLDDRTAQRIAQQLADVYAAIEQAAAELLRANVKVYAEEPPVIRLGSGFAEGADQIAVAACPSHWRVEAILPFPVENYLKDFEQSARDGSNVQAEFRASLARAATVTELPPPRSGNRNEGYGNAGGYLLRQIDLLIAVWDGRPPRPGGTGELVRRAHDGGVPVVWLATHEDKPPRLLAGFDDNGDPIAADAECAGRPLLDKLAPIVAIPGGARGDAARAGQTGTERFLAERWHTRSHFTAYDALKRIAHGQFPRTGISFAPFARRLAEWEPFLAAAPPGRDLHERIRAALLPRFLWADMLAVHYSHLYRSTYVVAYFLSAVAVFVALLAVFFEHDVRVKLALVISELVAIGLIIGLVEVGRRRLWHERWLDYRTLAESLRHGRFLTFISEFGRIQDGAAPPQPRPTPWMLGYIRATMREIGLPTAVLDATYQWRVLDATLTCEILGDEGQLAYHRGNADSAHRIDQMLHVTGMLCFFITFAVLFLFLIGAVIDLAWHPDRLHEPLIHLMPWITYVTAGLPALGAAVSGIRAHGDFDSSAERSARMVDLLDYLAKGYAQAHDRDIGLEQTGEMLVSAARIMSEDLDAWQELYGRKPLILPA
jgi:hypothetical protein